MNDVSKLQKVNSLARELMSHGQASSMEDAMRIAMRQIDAQAASGTSEVAAERPAGDAITGGLETYHDSSAQEQLEEVPEDLQMPQHEEGMSAEQMQHAFEKIISQQQSVLSRMTSVVNAQGRRITELNDKVNQIIGEISALKDELRKLKENPVVTPPLKPREAKEGQTQFKQEPAAPAPEKKPASSGHARSGNYKSDDVSIEKFFYYGNR